MNHRNTISANLHFCGEGDVPLATIVKFQSIMRGVLARKRVRDIYGF